MYLHIFLYVCNIICVYNTAACSKFPTSTVSPMRRLCMGRKVERQLLKIIERRHLKFLGHYSWRGKLENLCLGKVNGKRARGRQRKTFLQNFTHSNQQENYGMPPETEMNVGSCIKLVRLSPNRVALKKII